MTKAKVSELKARLSAYLAEVRTGETVVVYDRATPIARLVPFAEDAGDLVVIPAEDAPTTVKKLKGVRPSSQVDSDALLRELRRDR
jgi:prevent-host-death family protein